jgi:hypothetical protein
VTDTRVLVAHHRVHARVVGRARVGEVTLRRAVSDGLAEALEHLPVRGGYWILRRVSVTSLLGAAWTSGQMSRALAAEVAGAVAEVQARGVDPEQTLWFPDRAAFLARFLQDLAEGRAGGRWEYADLAGLLARTGSALEELAQAEPVELATALASLGTGVLESLALMTADEEAVLLRLAPSPAPRRGAAVATLRRLLAEGRKIGPLVLAVVSARDRGLPLAAVWEEAVVVAGLTDLATRAGPEAVTALHAGDWARLARLGDAFLPVVGWTDDAREELAAALVVSESRDSDAVPVERAHTGFGGAFLLAPLVDDLADWTADPDDSCLRLLVLTAALGRGSSTAPAYDPVVRALVGLSPKADPFRTLSKPVVRAAITVAPVVDEVRLAVDGSGPVHDLVAGAAAALLAALGRHLPGMTGATPSYLWTNVLDLDAWVTWGNDEHVVVLGHSPLAVLLSMAGLDRRVLRLRGHEEVRWTLTTAR